MNIAEARRTLREGTNDYVAYATACATIYANNHRTTPQVRDAAFGDEAISPRISRTPEGYLICRDAILSRCGQQLYHACEVPEIEPDEDGWVTVQRDAEEVFAPQSVAMFAGRPVVMGHPAGAVDGSNIREFAVGHVMSARRGEGENSDVLVGDLFITDPRAVDAILSGTHRSLAVGYDAAYRPARTGLRQPARHPSQPRSAVAQRRSPLWRQVRGQRQQSKGDGENETHTRSDSTRGLPRGSEPSDADRNGCGPGRRRWPARGRRAARTCDRLQHHDGRRRAHGAGTAQRHR